MKQSDRQIDASNRYRLKLLKDIETVSKAMRKSEPMDYALATREQCRNHLISESNKMLLQIVRSWSILGKDQQPLLDISELHALLLVTLSNLILGDNTNKLLQQFEEMNVPLDNVKEARKVIVYSLNKCLLALTAVEDNNVKVLH